MMYSGKYFIAIIIQNYFLVVELALNCDHKNILNIRNTKSFINVKDKIRYPEALSK